VPSGLKWADILCRVSTQAQAGEDAVSYDQQEANCRRWCENNGFRVREVRYEAKSASPSLDANERHLRPAFWASWDALVTGEINAIVFNDPTRVVREAASYLYFTETGRKYGAGIITVEGDGNLKGLSASHRKAMTFLQGWGSEVDNDNRARVFREKKAARFALGQLAAGRLPLGYVYDKANHKVKVDDEQAVAVRIIFDLYVKEDLSIVKVSKRLKEMGIPPASKLRGFNYHRKVDDVWDLDVLRKILRNQAYPTGKYRYPFEGKTYEIEVPAIIDRDTFDRAQRLLQTRRRVQRSGAQHLFSGRISCGLCEETFVVSPEGLNERARAAFHKGRFWDRRLKGYRPVYYCRWRNSPTARLRDREPCKASPVLWLEELEATLWQAIADHLSDPAKLARAATTHLARLHSEIAALTRGVGYLEQRIGELEGERERWRESWVKFGGDPRLIEDRIAGIDEELERVRAQADERRAEREKLHQLQDRKELIESALRHGLLNLWAVEDEGDYVRLRYQAGRVDPQDYERWSRLEYDPDRLDPEDWAAWERTSVRMSKKQLLDLVAIEVIAWPTRLEIRGVLSGVLPLSNDGLPDSSRIKESCDIARFSSRSGSFSATRSDTPQNCFGSRTFG
jgi:Recombinase/Resolvase, N terminal domain